jgi:hypothetical protein
MTPTRSAFAAAFAFSAIAIPALAQNAPVGDPEVGVAYVRLGPDAEGFLLSPPAPGPNAHVAMVFSHPNRDNFAERPGWFMAKRGYTVLLVNYCGEDGVDDPPPERYLPSISAGIHHLKGLDGVDKVVLLTHSGGGHLGALYQNVAETGPAACSGPEKIVPCDVEDIAGLTPADGVVFLDTTLGAAHLMTAVDPAMQPDGSRDPGLDMFAEANGFVSEEKAAYTPEFAAAFYAAQAARNDAIIDAALDRLGKIDAGEGDWKNDEPFVVRGIGVRAAGARPYLAERCDGLLATTLPARGLFHDDPFSLGVAGGFSTEAARAAFAEADLVLAVGCSLAQHNADAGRLFPRAHVLQVDIRPVSVSQGRVAAHSHLRADARLGVEALAAIVPARPAAQRSRELACRLRGDPADSASFTPEPGLHDPRDVVAALEAELPRDWEMVNSSGHCSYYFAQMPSRPVERFLTIREFGAIGNGLAFSMGVAAVRPGTPVVLFDGDGSAMMHIQELETIRREGLKIAVCILNDGAYGSEIHKLRAEGLSDAGATFGRPDFAGIARGFGLSAATVGDLADLPDLVADFAASPGATVWDLPVSDLVVSPVVRRSHPPGKAVRSSGPRSE